MLLGLACFARPGGRVRLLPPDVDEHRTDFPYGYRDLEADLPDRLGLTGRGGVRAEVAEESLETLDLLVVLLLRVGVQIPPPRWNRCVRGCAEAMLRELSTSPGEFFARLFHLALPLFRTVGIRLVWRAGSCSLLFPHDPRHCLP